GADSHDRGDPELFEDVERRAREPAAHHRSRRDAAADRGRYPGLVATANGTVGSPPRGKDDVVLARPPHQRPRQGRPGAALYPEPALPWHGARKFRRPVKGRIEGPRDDGLPRHGD